MTLLATAAIIEADLSIEAEGFQPHTVTDVRAAAENNFELAELGDIALKSRR